MATTRINTVQLIGDMEKVAAQLTQLIADMKDAAAQVFFNKFDQPDIAESLMIEKATIAKSAMRTKTLSSMTTPKFVITSITDSFDATHLISAIKERTFNILKEDISTVKGFSERQLEKIAAQTKFVVEGIASGEITEATKQFFLDGLKAMAENFIRILGDITEVMMEKLINAVIDVVWSAIEKAIGTALPSPF